MWLVKRFEPTPKNWFALYVFFLPQKGSLDGTPMIQPSPNPNPIVIPTLGDLGDGFVGLGRDINLKVLDSINHTID